jgi:hypothetical protein
MIYAYRWFPCQFNHGLSVCSDSFVSLIRTQRIGRNQFSRQNKNKTLTLSQKNGLPHEFSILRQSNGITAFLIQFCVEWCLSQTRETVRSHTKCKKWRQQNKNKTLTLSQKNGFQHEFSILRPSNGITVYPIEFHVDWCLRHAWETVPIQWHHCLPHQILRRLMPMNLRRRG